MKSKKGLIITVSVVILLAVIAATVIIPFSSRNFSKRYFSENLKNVDDIALIAECTEVDGKTCCVAGFKESVRLGANAVIVDLCFKGDGTPVQCNDYSLAETSDSIEELFEAMTQERFSEITVYLNIVQLSDISKLNELAVEYEVVDRLFLIGIDSEHYGLIDSDDTIIPFLLDYKFSSDELSAAEGGSFVVPEIIEKYGAAGLVVNGSQLSSELAETLNDYGIYYIASGVDGSSQMCKLLSRDVRNVIVPDVKEARETLDLWIEEMQKRNKAELESSIAAMSKKS